MPELSHGLTKLDDSCCWLPLAAESQRHRRVRLSHFFHIRGFGGCDCGGKVIVLGVEAVSPRRQVDRSVLAADFDEALGLVTCEMFFRPGGKRATLLAERQGLNSLKETAEMECSSDWVSVPEKV